jgi:hypothetical protein
LLLLDHRIFTEEEGWKEAESMQHPMLRLYLTTDESDYSHIDTKWPEIVTTYVTVVRYRRPILS